MKRQVILFTLCVVCCALLVAYSASAMEAARQGFYLWRDSVLPALLPFFVCAYIMQGCGALKQRNLLALYCLSMISGAPAGARLAGSLDRDYTDQVAALNAVSPMFIYGSFSTAMLGTPALAWPILLAQFLSAAIFLFFSGRSRKETLQAPPVRPFLSLLSDGLASGMSAMLNIGSAILCFMTLMALLNETGLLRLCLQPLSGLFEGLGLSPAIPEILLTGMLEMVTGTRALAQAGLPLRQAGALAAFFFSFGGICILAQSLAFARLRAGRYLLRKLLQGGLAGVLAYLLIPLFVPQAQSVFAPISSQGLLENVLSAAGIGAISLVAVSVILLLSAALGHIRKAG